MHLRTLLKLFYSFCLMMFYERLLDMKILYRNEEAFYFRHHGDPQRATESYRKALRLNPDNFYAHAGLAYLFAGQREFHRALEHADLAFRSKSGNVVRRPRISPNFIRLVIYQMLERSDEAKTVLDLLLVSLGGDLALVYNRLAYLYHDLGICDKAAQYCKEVIALRPGEPGLYENLARVYVADGRPEKARESLVKAREFAKSARQRRVIDRRILKIATG
jgi:tetratricopeptide (TPR) repeat protein